MSTYAAQLINSVPNISEKDYLELGTAWGQTFCLVNAKTKTGVDTLSHFDLSKQAVSAMPYITHDRCGQHPSNPGAFRVSTPATHVMTTDEFFAQNKRTFDVIFIDAFHHYDYVLRDYLNSVAVLNPGGYIFIHDLVPKDEFHASEDPAAWNGTGYKLLAHFIDIGHPCFVLNGDFGLTCVKDPRPIAVPPDVKNITYQDFLERLNHIRRLSPGQLVNCL